MFAAATLDAATRLAATLVALAQAAAAVIKGGGTYAFSERAAHAVFCRVARLVNHLGQLIIHGPSRRRRAQTKPSAPTPRKADRPPTPASTTNPVRTEDARLNTEPGWLLEALPDLAPALSAELAALLADPDLATMLDLEPGLRRTLNPLLRSLGLAPLPLPSAPPPDAAPPAPVPPEPPPAAPTLPSRHLSPAIPASKTTATHQRFLTPMSLR